MLAVIVVTSCECCTTDHQVSTSYINLGLRSTELSVVTLQHVCIEPDMTNGLDEGNKKEKKTGKHTQTSTHKLAQQVIFSESNSQMAKLTTTHTKTDLGLWRPRGKPHGE